MEMTEDSFQESGLLCLGLNSACQTWWQASLPVESDFYGNGVRVAGPESVGGVLGAEP